MTPKTVLAISGKRFSGKDTFADLVVAKAAERGIALATYAFADESKRMFAARSGADFERLRTDRVYKETRRPELTAFTVAEIGRDPLVFCRAVADRIEASLQPALVRDMRLLLEVEHFRSRFALHLVRLSRADEERTRSGFRYDAQADEHPTETELDDPARWDEVVPNDETIAALARRAEAIARARF